LERNAQSMLDDRIYVLKLHPDYPEMVRFRVTSVMKVSDTYQMGLAVYDSESKLMVMLERLGSLLLVRSPIVAITDLGLFERDLAIWIGEQNNKRSWGYINDHKDVIWYCCLIAYPEKLDSNFDILTRRISETADS